MGLLNEAVPHLTRVAVLWDPGNAVDPGVLAMTDGYCSNAKPSNMPGSRLTTSWRVKSKPSNLSCCRRGIGRSVTVGSRQRSSPYRRRTNPDAPAASRFRCVHEYECCMGIVTSIDRRYRWVDRRPSVCDATPQDHDQTHEEGADQNRVAPHARSRVLPPNSSSDQHVSLCHVKLSYRSGNRSIGASRARRSGGNGRPA